MYAKLSKAFLKTVKPRPKPYEVCDTELPGFLLRVQPSGCMTYYARYRVNGKHNRYRIGRADVLTPAQAREEAQAILAGTTLGDDPAEAKKRARAHTLGTFLEAEYEPWAAAHMKTGDEAIARIRACFPRLLKMKLHEITAWQVEKWRAKRIKAGRARATVNKDIATLRAALAKAQQWGHLEAHPLKGLKPLKDDASARVRFLSPEEEERLMAALCGREEDLRAERDSANAWRRDRGYPELPDLRAVEFADYLRPMVLLSLNTGLRRGELFNLEWADVDLPGGLLTVRGEGAKTHQTRHIPLNTDAKNVLAAWRGQVAGPGLVFRSPKGGRRFDNVNKAWRAVLKRAKVAGFRWHDMRHTFASRLVQAGVDLNTVRDLLGHSSIAMVLRYAHLSPEVKAAAVERISGWAAARPADNVVNFAEKK